MTAESDDVPHEPAAAGAASPSPETEGEALLELAKNPIARFAVLAKPEDALPSITVALQSSGEITMSCSSPEWAEEGKKILDVALSTLPKAAADDPASVSARWSAFRALVEGRGHRVADLPNSDFTTTMHLDLATGRMIGETEATHRFQDVASSIPGDMFAALRKMPTMIAERVAAAVAAALASGDHLGAARAMIDEPAAFLIGTAPEVLAASRKIDAARVGGAEAIELVRQRVAFASANRDFGQETAADIAWLRAHASASLDEAARGALAVADGCVAATAGRTEQALALWKEYATSNTAPEFASQRGWAWANISKRLPASDPEAAQAAEHGTDAFLQAGEHLEAARSSHRHAECILAKDPRRAIEILDEALSWFEKESLHDRDLRAHLHHARAVALLKLQRFVDCVAAAIAAADACAGIHGIEAERATSLMTASLALSALGRSEEARLREKEADALFAACKDEVAQLRRAAGQLAATFDASRAEVLLAEAKRLKAVQIEALLMVLIGSHGNRAHAERLAVFEGAGELLKSGRPDAEDLGVVATAIAVELERVGEPARALRYWRDVLTNDPLDVPARQHIAMLLFKLERWKEAADFFQGERERFGESPEVLLHEGRALLENGEAAVAVQRAHRAIGLCGDSHAVKPHAESLLHTALERSGGHVAPAPGVPAKSVVTRADLEAALHEFAAVIKGEERLAFWQAGPEGKRWVERPEHLAQGFLHLFLRAKFGEKAIVLQEVAAGAGRLDLLVICDGGFRAILELKMLGGTYPLSYALEGEGQILHYMDNLAVRAGFLVVFDGRSSFGTGIAPTIAVGASIVRTVFVDVRPTWKKARETGDGRVRTVKRRRPRAKRNR